MKVTMQLPVGMHTVVSSTGARLQADDKGHVEVERLSQDYYDLLNFGPDVYEVGAVKAEPVAQSPHVAEDQGQVQTARPQTKVVRAAK